MITIFSNIKIYAINDSYLDTIELKGCTTVEYFKRNRVLEDSPHYIGWRIGEIDR